MAKPVAAAKATPRKQKFGLADLWRTTLWALSAALAVTIAAYAGSTEIGRERIRTALAEIHEILIPSGVTPPRPLDAAEGRSLAETVRTLTADRDRLAGRLVKLEQGIAEVTGSIARVEKTAAQAAQAAQQVSSPAVAWTQVLPPPPATPPEDVTSSVASTPPAVVPIPQPPPAARPSFGLDLGSATTLEGLRAVWTAALRRHGALLETLRPIGYGRGAAEFHLIAGPIPNAAAAARYCATITAAGGICQPAPYEGQRLASH